LEVLLSPMPQYKKRARPSSALLKTAFFVRLSSYDHVYYFYSDGTVSAGTTNNPTKYRPYYNSGL
jgi:hypothetical protein